MRFHTVPDHAPAWTIDCLTHEDLESELDLVFPFDDDIDGDIDDDTGSRDPITGAWCLDD